MSDRVYRSARPTRHELKEDQLVTWSFQAWDWIQRNLKIVGGIVVAIVLAIVASQFVARSNARATAEANRTLAEASMSYWQGNYVRTIQLADQVLAEYGQTGAANDARRMKADALFWQGDFDSAAILYRAYLSKERRDGPLRTAVQTSLAYTLESKHDYGEAAKLYEEIAGKAPDRTATADFLLAAARSYAAAGDRERARTLYERIANEYKDTPYARDAEVALGELLAQSK